MDVSGPHAGRVHDFEAEEIGDLLWLIRRERGGTFTDALDWARHHLSLPAVERQARIGRQRQQTKTAKAAAIDAELDKRVRRARGLWAASEPLAGTLGEVYLTWTRGIPTPPSGWPEVVRYHRGWQALIVGATNRHGELRAVQVVYLTDEGTKKPGAGKLSFGDGAGAAVRLPAVEPANEGEAAGPVLGAEGPETGITVWAATGHETWIAIGAMVKLRPPTGRLTVICADDDPRTAPATKSLQRGLAAWRAAGVSAVVVWPWDTRRHDKTDHNDVAQTEGLGAVARRVALAIASAEHVPALQTVPLAVATQMMGRASSEFMRAAAAWVPPAEDDSEKAPPPPVQALRVSVGVGKSRILRQGIARSLTAMRARGDVRNVCIAVPTHALGAEQAEAFMAMPEARVAALTAAVWRGRTAADPYAPGFADPAVPRDRKITMCRDLEAVHDAQRIGADVEKAVCRQVHKNRETDEETEHLCPFFNECAYQAQKGLRADLWIVPHELIYSRKPAALGELAMLVVDEASWQDGLEGVQEAHPMALTLDTLRTSVVVPGVGTAEIPGVDARASEILTAFQNRVLRGFEAQPVGPVTGQAMREAMVLPSDCGDAVEWTWRRKEKPALYPGMPAAERREAVLAAAGNSTVMRLARLHKALGKLVAEGGPAASGWIAQETVDTADGPQRRLRLTGRRDIGAGWLVPTILLDATLDIQLVRPYWPQAVVTLNVEVETPWMWLRQLTGRDVPKNALIADKRCNDTERARREGNALSVLAMALREARRPGRGQALVVAQKAVKDFWREHFPIPAYVDLAHHNAVAGQDQWRTVTSLVVVGRTSPKPADVERLRGALTGEASPVTVPQGTHWPRVPARVWLADGTSQVVEAERHPDPIAEAIRWQICEGELIQIIGRGRGVRRTAANALEVLLLTDRPLPVPVSLVTWDDLEPSPADLMLAAAGVAFESPADAARAYPYIWNTAEAAKKAGQRWHASHGCEQPVSQRLVPMAYQRSGAGCRPTRLAYEPSTMDCLPDWLAERLGKLAHLDSASEPPALPPPVVVVLDNPTPEPPAAAAEPAMEADWDGGLREDRFPPGQGMPWPVPWIPSWMLTRYSGANPPRPG